MVIRRVLALYALGIVSSPGFAQVKIQTDGTYQFGLKLAKGGVYRFKVVTERTTGKAVVHIELPLVVQIVDEEKGIYSVTVKQGPLRLEGRESGTVSIRNAKIDAFGKVTGDGAYPFPTPPIPKGFLRIGDVWTARAPLGQVQNTVDARYKLRGFTSKGGRRLAQIGIAVDTQVQGLSLVGNGEMFIAMDDGVLYSIRMGMFVRAIGKDSIEPVHLVTSVSR